MGCNKSKQSKQPKLTYLEENDLFEKSLKEYSETDLVIFNITRNSEFRIFIGHVNFDRKCHMECFHKSIQLEPADYREDDCPICLESLSNKKQKVVKLSICSHYFHEKCIQKHFQTNGETCPMCRAKPFVPPHILKKIDYCESEYSSERSFDSSDY